MTEATLADDLDEAVFLFTFPPIQSAIKIHGTGEGMRVQLEIPESENAESFKLLAMRGCICEARVTVKLRQDDDERERNERKPQWSYDQATGLA